MKTINFKRLVVVLFCSFVNIVSFYAQYQLSPECSVEIDGNRYIIHFTLPEYIITEDSICDMLFSSIEMGDDVDYDITDEAGYPALPFFSLDLLIPECVTNVWGYMEEESTSSEELDYLIQPAMLGSWITEDGEYVNLDEECCNWEYYSTGATEEYPNGYCMEYYSLSNIYTFSGTQGVTLNIHPFVYNPAGTLDVLSEATIVIEFDCGSLESTINDLQSQGTYSAYVAQLYYDTFGGEIEVVYNSGENGNYLILAANRDFETYLSPYVNYKRGQNYITEVVYLDECNLIGDSQGIKAYIDTNTVVSDPDFVLLVGSLSEIPPFAGGNNTANPYTDEGYHDFVGRWIIDEPDYGGGCPDLLRVIEKTIATEMDYVDTQSTAALFSSSDNNKRWMQKSFYKNIERIAAKSFGQMGIPYTLYDGRDYISGSPLGNRDMISAIENGPRFFIYRGHGASTSVGEPYVVDISYLNTSTVLFSPCSMGFGFACDLNSYTTDSNFGARWVLSSSGGVSFYSATCVSYHYPNNVLAKRIFKELKKLTNKTDNFSLSVWLRISEQKYYRALMGPVRNRQVRTYNLIGDPTLAVYGMDIGGNYAPFHMPPKDKETIEQSESFDRSQIHSVEVYDVSGKKIASSNDEQRLPIEDSLFSGVYIIKVTYANGTISTNKLIK